MNVIITTTGTAGDMIPFIIIAKKLKDKGHSVVILANSNHEKLIKSKGIDFYSIEDSDEFDQIMDYTVNNLNSHEGRPKGKISNHVDVARKMFVSPVRKIYEYVKEHNESNNTIIISNYICQGTRYVEYVFNIPSITVVLVPYYFRSKYNPPTYSVDIPFLPKGLKNSLFSKIQDRVMIKPMFNGYKEFDLSKYGNYEKRFSPKKVISMAPSWYAEPEKDWPQNVQALDFLIDEEFNNKDLPSDVEEFLDLPGKVVVFNSGSKYRKSKKFYIESAEICKKLGIRGLFIGRNNEDIPDSWPSYIKEVSSVPLEKALLKADALVSHGGIGTCAIALKAGVPQIIVPEFNEHYDTGKHIEKLEVGYTISREKYISGKAVQKVNELLNSESTLNRAKELSVKFFKDYSANAVVDELMDEIENLMV